MYYNASRGRSFASAFYDADRAPLFDLFCDTILIDIGYGLNRAMEPEMISQAIIFATEAHFGQRRKGTITPYIWHPLSVGKLLQDADAPAELVVAGILHDTLEDTAVTLEEIRERFGSKVAEIVDACSEADKSLSWEDRKAHAIESLKTASPEIKLVSAADKLDNLRSMRSDLAKVGSQLWARFKRGRQEQEQYHRGVLASLKEGAEEIASHPIIQALELEIERVFGPGESSLH